MKYKVSIDIDLPRDKVIEIMDQAENMKHWQRGLQSYDFLSGEPGQLGSKMALNYKNGKREFALTETVTKNDFPASFHATYEMKNVWNEVRNTFSEIEAGKTRWESENVFRFDNFMYKLMGWVMPGAFKKQSLKYMQDFKAFAEKGESVAEQ